MTGRINRRSVLAGAASIATLPAAALPAAAAQHAFHGKLIPASREVIPAIGMGTWRTFDVGSDPAARTARKEVLRTFFALGGKLVDSSPMYGSSQTVLGAALDELNQKNTVFAADKVWIRGGVNGPAQIAETRRRWGVEQFDLFQIHNLLSWRAHLETLQAMKADGRIRYIGVTSYSGLRYDDIARIMSAHPIDFIQITYNIADRDAENRLLPLARERGVAVIANRPFREGALIDYARRHPLPGLAADIGAANWAQFLLKFIISHPDVTVAIPATRRVDHMKENMGALTGPLPDAGIRAKMITAFNAL